MKNMRLHWDAESGWLLDVPLYLPNHVLAQVIKWAYPRQLNRLRSLPPGDKRDELERVLPLLKDGKLKQRVVGTRGDSKGDLVIFSSGAERD